MFSRTLNSMRERVNYLPIAIGVLLVCSACGSGNDAPPVDTNGNNNPNTATCQTKVVMSCRSGTECHELYSTLAADSIESACVQLNYTMSSEPCSPDFGLCCIHLTGSNEMPEGICIPASASNASTWSTSCANYGEPTVYCKR
jgi:hypothetical protein